MVKVRKRSWLWHLNCGQGMVRVRKRIFRCKIKTARVLQVKAQAERWVDSFFFCRSISQVLPNSLLIVASVATRTLRGFLPVNMASCVHCDTRPRYLYRALNTRVSVVLGSNAGVVFLQETNFLWCMNDILFVCSLYAEVEELALINTKTEPTKLKHRLQETQTSLI